MNGKVWRREKEKVIEKVTSLLRITIFILKNTLRLAIDHDPRVKMIKMTRAVEEESHQLLVDLSDSYYHAPQLYSFSSP